MTFGPCFACGTMAEKGFEIHYDDTDNWLKMCDRCKDSLMDDLAQCNTRWRRNK